MPAGYTSTMPAGYTSTMPAGSTSTLASKLSAPRVESCQFGPWKVTATKSHILGSKCSTPEQCKGAETSELCDYCSFEQRIQKRSLPDMIFNRNTLTIIHSSGAGLEFTAEGALNLLRDKDEDSIQVAHAKEWKEARKDCEHTHNVVADYDWTYTTDYCGALLGDVTVQPTNDRIDVDKLRTQEPIRFFHELYLYEDELDDNGATNCVVKIRCMDSGFLVLLRHYLRVDHVLVRVKETRVYHETGSQHLIRERVTKAKKMDQLDVPGAISKCPDQVSPHLDLREEIIEKIHLPASPAAT